MAVPHFTDHDSEEIATGSNELTGYVVPAGAYGLVKAAGPGIIKREGFTDQAEGMAALERLAGPDHTSKSPEFDGRRMVRVKGGFLILNFFEYRDRDHSNAERQKRYRQRKALQEHEAAKKPAKKPAAKPAAKSPKPAASSTKAMGERAEVIAFARECKATAAQGEDFFDKMEAGGWMRGKVKVKDWKAHFRTYNRNGWLAGQYGFDDPEKPEIVRAPSGTTKAAKYSNPDELFEE